MIEPEVRLRRAIHAQDTALVARIIKSHPHLLHNPDTSSPTTHTPSGLSNTSLHLASSINCLPICKLLLDLGHEGKPEVPQTSLNENYETPLHLAAREGHSEVVHLFCERCPTCILRRDIRGKNALMVAAIGGHDTVLQILLTFAPGRHDGGEEDTKKIVDAVDHDGNTALHFATMYGHLPVLRTLLAAGADWEKRNCWSWQPVSYCATVQVEVYYKGLVSEAERKRKFAAEPQNPNIGNPVTLAPTGNREEI